MPFPPPPIAPPELEDFQWYFNGLRFGAGTPWAVLKAEGLDMVEIRNGDVSFPRDHGESRGLDLYKGRDIIFDLWMKTDGTSLQDAQEQLAAATSVQPSEEPLLWFKLPNLPVLAIPCRPRKKKLDVDANYAAANVSEPELVLHATDPRIYSAGAENTLALKEPPTEPGNVAELDNTGNTESRPIVVFTGPLARPFVESGLPGNPRLSFFDPSADESEQAASAAELQAFVAEWELYPVGVRVWSGGTSYKKLQYVKTVDSFGAKVERYYVALQDNEGHSPETGKTTEFWEFLGGSAPPTLPEPLKSSDILAKEKVVRERQESEEKEHREAREKEEKEGTRPTVKAGDQLLVDLGDPHLIQYYPGGVAENEPEDVYKWLTGESTWWDLPPGVSKVSFSSFDGKDTGGTAKIQWASARQL